MRGSLIVLTWAMVLICSAAGADPRPPAKATPGWFGIYPYLENYSLMYQPAVVAAGKDPAVYSQVVQYDWMGNDFRQGTATLARDPAFKTKYAADALKKEGATEVVVGKKSGWLRLPRLEGGEEVQELVVPLSEDKALILRGGNHFGMEELTILAGRFDLGKAEKTLAKPPRTEKQDKEAFRALPDGAPWHQIVDWLGLPDKTQLKDMRVLGADYSLPDGGAVHLSIDEGKLTGAAYTDKDGKREDLKK